ncbi:hypothetical protein AB3331_02070 [Streptococcus sp. H49]|uniref:hypothetical protein n=1 Tax=Streptococcus huangxiaojuni TaxID=3237239 RepID=UPI0034A1CA48
MIGLEENKLKAVGCSYSLVNWHHGPVICVTKDKTITEDDEATYVKLSDSHFHNGIIEADVLSRLLPDAPDHARGFIGIAFRIAADDSIFEAFYIRPTNGRSDLQLRRNRATQYFSYPHFKYMHSRRSHPGEYEAYADMTLDEWIHLKIAVQGSKAQFYLHHQEQPTLIVNDLKHGDSKGQVGLWVDVGTEGFFKNVKIIPL